jgi:ATP-dependent helicase HrpB
MQDLPIDPVLPELCEKLAATGALVLEAPPGAGKTTRVPIAIHKAGLSRGGEVWVAEPRRLAARMAAGRVASELGEPLGRQIGYRVRFEEVAGPSTKVFYATEGVLVRRLLSDPKLRGIGAVVLDEFHERHLDTDLLLALLWRLKQTSRPDLALLVMSATLDAEPVAAFLGGCSRVRSEGRMFAVDIEHLPTPDDRPLEKRVVSAVKQLLRAEPDGDILVFLPGAAEIRRAEEALAELAREQNLFLAPLHGDLPIADQVRAVERAQKRKVVLSTNVAESSVTIEGVTGVVDSGLARVATHSPWSGLPSLKTAKVSRASATQRAGRAGRTRPGRVLRLYTQGDFSARPEHDAPEILRADLAETLLVLHGSGLDLQSGVRWLVPPPNAHLDAGRELLGLLGALDEQGVLTPIGRRMLELPLHPRLARIAIEGERRGVTEETRLVAALLGERDIRLSTRTDFGRQRGPADTATGPSDLLELVDSFELARSLGFDAHRLRAHGLDARSVSAVARAERQLARASKAGAAAPAPERREEALLMAFLTGFPDRAARRRKPGGSDLILQNGSTAKLSPSSVVRSEELMIAVDVDESATRTLSGGANVRLASAIRGEWLLDLFSDRVSLEESHSFNAEAERVERVSRMTFGALVLEESRAQAAPGPEATRVLVEALATRGAQEFLRSDALTTWKERVALLCRYYPKADFATALANSNELEWHELCDGLTSFAELRALDPVSKLGARLPASARRLLEQATPEQVRLPGGRQVPIHYEPGKPPWMESRLQDFFGMADGPRLCEGKLAVTLHLLAPNARAVQVTTDLAGFWERHYPGIRRELMRRYPRHSWPEDGRHAVPPPPRTRGAR